MLSLVVMYEPTTAMSAVFTKFMVLSLIPPSTSSKIFLLSLLSSLFLLFYLDCFLGMVGHLDSGPDSHY